MPTAADILREESALGRWPRRLLHVGTLMSYEWQPGNRYGSAVEPVVCRNHVYAGSLEVKGRRDDRSSHYSHKRRSVGHSTGKPLRFTVQDLEAVITRARTSPPSTTSTAGVPQRIDFVWLDVAFIDQRENNPKAVSEMGRQADVFRGASFVYAWLSAISIQQLNQIFGARTAFERPNRALRPMVLVLVDTPGSLLADRRCLHLKGCTNRPGSASLEETPPPGEFHPELFHPPQPFISSMS
jgi:hypothetical protein